MIKNDFEKLNSDDWLRKEIEREKRVSAWDFDEGRRVRNEHAENCDARDNALEHEIRHNLRRPVEPYKIINDPSRSRPTWFVIDLFLLVILTVFHAYLDSNYYMGMNIGSIAFLSLMFLNPAAIIYFVMKRKVLPNWYYLLTFIVAVSIELFWIFVNIRFLYFVFRR